MRTIRLGDCIRVKHGYPFDGDHIITKDNGIVLTTPGNFTLSGGFKEDNGKFYDGEYSNEYVLKSGTLIVTMTDLSKACDTLGFGAIVPDTGYTYLHNQRIGVVSILDSSVICKDYLYWVMRSKTYRRQIVLTSTGGSTVHHTSPEKIYDIVVDIPESIDEQKQIAHVLNTIDFQISNNKEICSDLESMAKLLYDYWFVQFDFPDENGKPYKSSGGKMVWNEELKREIPDGWEVKPLSAVFDITMGSSPSGASLNENGDGIEFYQGSTDFGNIYPTKRVYTTAPVRFSKAQDVLLSVRAPVGTMNIAMNDCCIGRGLAAIHHFSTMFAWNTMLTFSAYFDIFNNNGTTFGALTSDDLKGQLTAVPPENLINKYHGTTIAIEKQIRNLSKENQELASLRDFLLPMLMNGQVTVKKGETQ